MREFKNMSGKQGQGISDLEEQRNLTWLPQREDSIEISWPPAQEYVERQKCREFLILLGILSHLSSQCYHSLLQLSNHSFTFWFIQISPSISPLWLISGIRSLKLFSPWFSNTTVYIKWKYLYRTMVSSGSVHIIRFCYFDFCIMEWSPWIF